MISLLFAMALLGLTAVDPVGIAAMPFLLMHKRPIFRSLLFLLGGFLSLVILGFVLSSGLGDVVLRYERAYNWVVPLIELVAGVILLCIAGFLLWKGHDIKRSSELSRSVQRKLAMSNVKLLVFGAIIVTVQSIVDVVFIVAMIRVQELHLSLPELFIVIVTYALAALAIQISIVVAYACIPTDHRKRLLEKVNHATIRYAHQAVIVVSLVFGAILCVNSALTFMGYAHF